MSASLLVQVTRLELAAPGMATGALPAELHLQGRPALELASALGGIDGTRTHSLLSARQALFQLSYDPMVGNKKAAVVSQAASPS